MTFYCFKYDIYMSYLERYMVLRKTLYFKVGCDFNLPCCSMAFFMKT